MLGWLIGAFEQDTLARAIANGDQSALSAALKSGKVQVKKQKKWAGGDRGTIFFPYSTMRQLAH